MSVWGSTRASITTRASQTGSLRYAAPVCDHFEAPRKVLNIIRRRVHGLALTRKYLNVTGSTLMNEVRKLSRVDTSHDRVVTGSPVVLLPARNDDTLILLRRVGIQL